MDGLSGSIGTRPRTWTGKFPVVVYWLGIQPVPPLGLPSQPATSASPPPPASLIKDRREKPCSVLCCSSVTVVPQKDMSIVSKNRRGATLCRPEKKIESGRSPGASFTTKDGKELHFVPIYNRLPCPSDRRMSLSIFLFVLW